MKLQKGLCYYSPYEQAQVYIVEGPNAKGHYTTDTGMDYTADGEWVGGLHKLEEIPLDTVLDSSVDDRYVAALEAIVGSEGCKMLKEILK
jgi:hypothetical protein